MWLSRATARLLTQLPTFSVRTHPTSKGCISVCYRVSLCTNMIFRTLQMEGSWLRSVSPTVAQEPSICNVYLRLAPAHSWKEQDGDNHTSDKTTDVVEDADAAIGEAPDKVESKPEEPVGDSAIPVHPH